LHENTIFWEAKKDIVAQFCRDFNKNTEKMSKKSCFSNIPTLDFKKIVDILRLYKRKYYSRSIEYPQMTRDEFEPKVTKIEISG